MKMRTTQKAVRSVDREKPGLLLGISNPPPALAQQYQSQFSMAKPPSNVLLGVPASSIENTALERALIKSSMTAMKLVTKQLAAQPGVPQWVGIGVDVGWFAVKAYGVHQRWQSPDRNVPVLMIDTTGMVLNALNIGSDVSGVGGEFFNNAEIQDNIGTFMTAGKALVNDRDLSLALMNHDIGKTDTGKILGLVTPIIEASINQDPMYGKVKLGPLPEFILPKPAESS